MPRTRREQAGARGEQWSRWEQEELVGRLNRRLFGPRRDPETGLWVKYEHRSADCGQPVAARQTAGRSLPRVDEAGIADPGHMPAGVVKGLVTCGSANVCLRCAGRVRVERALEIEAVIREHHRRGGWAVFATFTASHERVEDVGVVVDDSMEGWRGLVNSGPWRRLRAEADGFVRSTEVTYTDRNGAHPHHHVLVLLPYELGPAALEALRVELAESWRFQMTKRGRSVDETAGVTLVPVKDDAGIGYYVSKISLEMTRSDRKTGKGGSRSHWELALDAATGTGRTGAGDRQLWREFVQAMSRHRFISYSRGLLESFGLAPAKTDEELAAVTPEIENVLHLEPQATRALSFHLAIPDLKAALARGDSPERIVSLLMAATGRELWLSTPGPGDRGLPTLRVTPKGRPPEPAVLGVDGWESKAVLARIRDMGRATRDELAASCARKAGGWRQQLNFDAGSRWNGVGQAGHQEGE